MNKLPIINIEIFIKSTDIDGIVIKCDGNPFNVNSFYTIINLKS